MSEYNDLTNAELELLAMLAEECGEVIQIVGKIIRHGFESNWKDNPTNRLLLEKELADVELIVEMMKEQGTINEVRMTEHIKEKITRINQFMYYNEVYSENS